MSATLREIIGEILFAVDGAEDRSPTGGEVRWARVADVRVWLGECFGRAAYADGWLGVGAAGQGYLGQAVCR